MELRSAVRHDARGAVGGVSHAGRTRGRDEAIRLRLVRPCVHRCFRAVLLLLAGVWVGQSQSRHFGYPCCGGRCPGCSCHHLIWPSLTATDPSIFLGAREPHRIHKQLAFTCVLFIAKKSLQVKFASHAVVAINVSMMGYVACLHNDTGFVRPTSFSSPII